MRRKSRSKAGLGGVDFGFIGRGMNECIRLTISGGKSAAISTGSSGLL
jgi:hypothetical protein